MSVKKGKITLEPNTSGLRLRRNIAFLSYLFVFATEEIAT